MAYSPTVKIFSTVLTHVKSNPDHRSFLALWESCQEIRKAVCQSWFSSKPSTRQQPLSSCLSAFSSGALGPGWLERVTPELPSHETAPRQHFCSQLLLSKGSRCILTRNLNREKPEFFYACNRQCFLVINGLKSMCLSLTQMVTIKGFIKGLGIINNGKFKKS